MSENSEIITVSEKNQPSSLDAVAGEAMKAVPFKLLFFIYIIYIFLSSDVYIDRILSNVDGATGFGSKATTFGTMITGILLVIFSALSNFLIEKQII